MSPLMTSTIICSKRIDPVDSTGENDKIRQQIPQHQIIIKTNEITEKHEATKIINGKEYI